MRGIHHARRRRDRRGGISPAHAGNTCPVTWSPASVEDQPRTCGEYGFSFLWLIIPDGSAPHMRGIPDYLHDYCALGRISPAHAGNTAAYGCTVSWAGDQPRTCGEYGLGPGLVFAAGGSAPHMRGIPDRIRDHRK